jgi:hypothetical protein
MPTSLKEVVNTNLISGHFVAAPSPLPLSQRARGYLLSTTSSKLSLPFKGRAGVGMGDGRATGV